MMHSLDMEWVARTETAAAARWAVQTYLDEAGWPQSGRTELVSAVSEAVTNAVQHAYSGSDSGTVKVRAHILTGPNGSRRICIRVTDHGSWCQPTHSTRGGLSRMRAVTAHLSIQGNATGTRVTMISHPEPAIPPECSTTKTRAIFA